MRDVRSQHTVTLRVFLPFNVDIRKVDTPWTIREHRVVNEWEIVAVDDLHWSHADEAIERVRQAITDSLNTP